jgi:hypothetical protein
MSDLDTIESYYSGLLDMLGSGEWATHDEECAYRCLRSDCRADHWCDKCQRLQERERAAAEA